MLNIKKSIFASLFLLCASLSGLSQGVELGLFGGTNYSRVSANTLNSTVVGNPMGFEKTYNPITDNQAWQLGALIRFDAVPNLLAISLEPQFGSYVYSYSNVYAWEGRATLQRTLDFRHKLSYIELPLFLELRFIAGGFEPYVKVGGYLGFLQAGTSQIESTEVNSDLAPESSLHDKVVVSSLDAFVKKSAGLAVGLGVRYNFGPIKVGLDLALRKNLQPITNTDTRFENAELLNGFYDVSDDLSFMNVAINLQLLMPINLLAPQKGSGRMRGAVPCPKDL